MLAKYVCLGLISLLIVNYATAFTNLFERPVQVVEGSTELDPSENFVPQNLDGVPSEEQQRPIITAFRRKISTALNNARSEIQKGLDSAAHARQTIAETGVKVVDAGKQIIVDKKNTIFAIPKAVLEFFKAVTE